MTKTVQLCRVDAFTQQLFTGNPASVVLGAERLSDEEMFAMARELNNGDTAFVLPPDGDDHDLDGEYLNRSPGHHLPPTLVASEQR